VGASALIAEDASVANLSRIHGHASRAITLNTKHPRLYEKAEHDEPTREQNGPFGQLPEVKD